MNIQPKDTSVGHFYVSLVKSALRICAGASFVMAGLSVNVSTLLIAGGIFLIVAEVLGIVEELV